MIAETDGGMIEVVVKKPKDRFIEIPDGVDIAKFMNEQALTRHKAYDYDYKFWDRYQQVRQEHLSV